MRTSFPKTKIKVLLLEGVHPAGAQRLKDEGFAVTTNAKALDEKALTAALADGVHVLGIRSKTQVSAAALKAAERLLTIGCFCIGTNQVALDACSQSGVSVFNSPFSNTRSVAEITIAEIISLNRRMVDQSILMHQGTWDKSAAGAHEVRGRTLGLVGYGHIGSQVSVLAEAMGMRVLFHDIISKLPLGNAKQVRSLDELLKSSDVISLHVPETPATMGMIGKAQIKLMRKGSMLINNARGTVVDVPALADAIRSGHLAGAALDVFPEEPAGKDEPFKSELMGLPNVILTPHVGGSTEEAQENIAHDVVDKFIRFVNNGSTSQSVNMPQVDLPSQGEQDERGKGRAHRILHFHRNVPGVLKQVNAAMADEGINILSQYLQTRGEIGYVVFDIEPSSASKRIVEKLRSVPATLRVRPLW